MKITQAQAVEMCGKQFKRCFSKVHQCEPIPKIIHFIWIGPNPQPKTFIDHYQKQWREAHPDFEFRVWVEESLDKEEFTLSKIILDKSLNPGLRADALRYEILYKYGGIYVDTDMALVKPIHSLLDSFQADLFICVSFTEPFEVNNAIIGCVPKHPLINVFITKLNLTFTKESEARRKQLAVMQ